MVSVRRALRVGVADEQARQLPPARGVVQEEYALVGLCRPAQHVADLEADAVARARGLGDQQFARVEPLDVSLVHAPLGQRRLRAVDVVGEEMGGLDLVAVLLEPGAHRAGHSESATISTNGAGEVDEHRHSLGPLNYSVRMRVRIRRLNAQVKLPQYETAAAAAFDFAAATDLDVPPGEVRLVPTGLVIEVPAGMFLGVFARSGTPLKRGLMVANGVGVVDPDYCGPTDEVKIAVLNFTSRPVTIHAGDRLAQGIFLPAARVEWEEASEFLAQSRGGFGSTDARGVDEL
jgi:dUTP pyrophosphatase